MNDRPTTSRHAVQRWLPTIIAAVLLAVAVLVVTLGGQPVASSRAASTPPATPARTWEFQYFGAITSGGNADKAFADWITTLPASCDVQAFPAVTNLRSIIAYYRCPIGPSAPASSPMARAGTLTASPPKLAVGDIARATDSVNLRGGPTTNASAITTLNAGERLTIVAGPVAADSYAWYQVRTADGTTGWIAADFLQLVAPATP